MSFGLKPARGHQRMAHQGAALLDQKMQTAGGNIEKEIPQILFLVRQDADVDNGIPGRSVQFLCCEMSYSDRFGHHKRITFSPPQFWGNASMTRPGLACETGYFAVGCRPLLGGAGTKRLFLRSFSIC